MRKKDFFLLAMVVLWFGMIIRTFFWWNWNNEWDKPKIHDTWTWFIEEITNTWDSIELISNNTQTDKKNKNYTEIRIMIPKYFYNSEWKRFGEDLYEDKKIYLKFIFIDDLNSYRDQVFENDFSQADLFLFPYDRISKTPTVAYARPWDLENYFDPFVKPLITSEKISFIPFAADPIVIYVTSWFSYQNNFYWIFDYASDRESAIPLSFPIFFGIDKQDLNDKWFKREYQDIIRYALMHYFTTNNDNKQLWARIDISAAQSQSYNIENLNKISNTIKAPWCKYFPSICFQTYKYNWLRFWFLSDADVVNTYFTWKKSNFDKLSIMNLPFSQLESPVRIRWRWIPPSLNDINVRDGIKTFLLEYITKSNQYDLRNSTLPVIKWNSLLDNEYIWLRWYILVSWWDYINTLRRDSNFWDLIDYKITATDYLR